MIKYIGWLLSVVWFCVATLMYVTVNEQSKLIEYQQTCLNNVKHKNDELLTRQRNLDWFESKIAEIDDYIKWKDTLLIKGYETVKPIERSSEELYQARLEVITKAITMGGKDD